jgi:hypothetical protein
MLSKTNVKLKINMTTALCLDMEKLKIYGYRKQIESVPYRS